MGEKTEIFVNLLEAKRDLIEAISECQKRGLINNVKWLSELNYGLKLPDFKKEAKTTTFADSGISDDEYDNYLVAKSFFDCKEYDRAAFFTRNCVSPVPKFLNLYSTFMAKEKKRIDDMMVESQTNLKDYSELLSALREEYNQKKLDGYMLYLYGVILKKLDLNEMAITVFLESVHKVPTLWGSWLELAPLISDLDKLRSLFLPQHWMKHFFIGHTLIEIYLNEDGISLFEDLQHAGFDKCLYVTSQIAIAYHNKRDVDQAIQIFQDIQRADPYRLDNMDIYSNLLFVKELKTEMANLAHKAVEINKYRPETCCVIGNYYSIRGDHQKAVVYFQRALKLNPKYLSAWTLMGHEFMEMKNTNAAIQSYRQAVEVNRRDFRAWYGLGQAYEIIKMYCYSLYYYKKAQELRPYDSRMLVALGETYEKLEKNSNALKCYQKAYNVGDIEGVAILKLAVLYETLNDRENAVLAYKNYVADARSEEKSQLCRAYQYLSEYYFSRLELDEADHYAYKILELDEGKAEAKAILKSISIERTRQQQNKDTEKVPDDSLCDMVMDECSIDNLIPPTKVIDDPIDIGDDLEMD